MHNVRQIRATAVSVVAGLSLGLGVFAVAPASAAGFFGIGAEKEQPEPAAAGIADSIGGIGGLLGLSTTVPASDPEPTPAPDPAPDPAPAATDGEEDGCIVLEGPSVGIVEPLVVVDDQNAYAAVKGIGKNENGVWTMIVELENRTSAPMMFNMYDCCVNDWLCDPYWCAQVEAGQVLTSSISWWYSEDLPTMGVEDFLKIEFNFEAYNSEDYGAEDYFDTAVCVFPKGAKAFEAAPQAAMEGTTVYDDGTYRLLFLKGEGEKVYFYFENGSSDEADAEIQGLSINGLTFYASSSSIVPAGKHALLIPYLSEEELVEAGVTSCGSMKALFTIMNWDNFEVVASDIVEFYRAEDYVPTARGPQATDIVLADERLYSMVAYGAERDEWGDVVLKLYVENKSDSPLMFYGTTSTVDGVEVMVSMYGIVAPGDGAYLDVTWSSYALEEAGLTDAAFDTATVTYEAFDMFTSMMLVDSTDFTI